MHIYAVNKYFRRALFGLPFRPSHFCALSSRSFWRILFYLRMQIRKMIINRRKRKKPHTENSNNWNVISYQIFYLHRHRPNVPCSCISEPVGHCFCVFWHDFFLPGRKKTNFFCFSFLLKWPATALFANCCNINMNRYLSASNMKNCCEFERKKHSSIFFLLKFRMIAVWNNEFWWL